MLDKWLWRTAALYLVLMMAGCAPFRPTVDLSGGYRPASVEGEKEAANRLPVNPSGQDPAAPAVEHSAADIQVSEIAEAVYLGEEIVAIARQYLGVPYLAGGTTPVGFDCSGLVFHAYRRVGIAIPRTSREQFRFFQPVDRAALLPGDLLFFRLQRQRISHVGIFVTENLFLHAPSPGKGVSYASLENPFWDRRFAGAGRLDPREENE